jgi:hypothetical protein
VHSNETICFTKELKYVVAMTSSITTFSITTFSTRVKIPHSVLHKCYAKHRHLSIWLIADRLSVIMLSAIMPNLIIPCVIMMCDIMLSVNVLNVMAQASTGKKNICCDRIKDL